MNLAHHHDVEELSLELEEAAEQQGRLDDGSAMHTPLYHGGEAPTAVALLAALQYAFDASQPWAAAAAVGVICGLISCWIEVATHWLSDLKLGYCNSNIWASEALCCVGSSERCDEFYYWDEVLSKHPGLHRNDEGGLSPTGGGGSGGFQVAEALRLGFHGFVAVDYAMYVAISVSLAVFASWLCVHYAPFASGSGIVEIKTILSGARIPNYLSAKVLGIKCVGLCASVGSGLTLGKEGPFVHVGCCVGALVSRWFPRFRNGEESANRELISVGGAVGVAVAFGAPIGGVLFALEEIAYVFPHRAMLQAFFAAVISTLVVRHFDPTHTGRVVQFAVSYHHEFRWFELGPFLVIGVMGGVVGAFMNSVNHFWLKLKKYSILPQHPVWDVAVVTFVTAMVGFPIPLLRPATLDTLTQLFDDCSAASVDNVLCLGDEGAVLMQTIVAAFTRMVLFSVTFGLKLPAGCFVPSLFIGAALGRGIGIWTKAEVAHHMESYAFLHVSCGGDYERCVIPGVYAVLGAAAVLAGVTRMTLCLVVIMFELTGGLEYVVPCMVVTISSKWIAELLGVPSIYDLILSLSSYSFISNKVELRNPLVTVKHVLEQAHSDPTHRVVVFVNGMSLQEVQVVIKEHPYRWYPVVEDRHSMVVLGAIPRAVVQQLVQHEQETQQRTVQDRQLSLGKRIGFSQSFFAIHTSATSRPSTSFLDWTSYVDNCRVQAGPDTPASQLLNIFQTIGSPHVMVVDGSRVVDMCTRRDMALFLKQVPEMGSARDDLMRWLRRTSQWGNAPPAPTGRSPSPF